jgi:hypothetical protein
MLDSFLICGVHLQPGQFSTRIASIDTSDFRNFCLMDSIEYLSLAGVLYRIPKFCWSDLASIPRPLWSELPPQGEDGAEYGLAAYGHDAAYRDRLLMWPAGSMPNGTPIPNDNTGWIKATLPKADCDLLLKEMMLACKVPDLIAEVIYQGVHIGGQSAFDKDRI